MSEDFVGESWNGIRFVDIEWYPKCPGSDSDRDRARSAFREYEFWLLLFQYLPRLEYPLYEFEWVEKDSDGTSTQEFIGRDRDESDTGFLCFFLFHTATSTDPDIVLQRE